jgi:hypothetical protein
MSKKHFIALADTIRMSAEPFSARQIDELARFCKSQNGHFKTDRWIDYINGLCGPSGGAVKTK